MISLPDVGTPRITNFWPGSTSLSRVLRAVRQAETGQLLVPT